MKQFRVSLEEGFLFSAYLLIAFLLFHSADTVL